MAVDFRCEHCGKLLSAEAYHSAALKCSHCGKKVTVPEVLASLLRPSVPSRPARPTPSVLSSRPPEQFGRQGSAGTGAVGVLTARMTPWLISVFFHIVLALIMMLIAMIVVSERIPAEATIPDAVFSGEAAVRMNPGKWDPKLRTGQAELVDRRQFARRATAIRADTGETKKRIELIGLGADGPQGGALAAFGLRSGGGLAGPKTSFYGSGGNAHHVVYVIDRSGSMVVEFPYVRREILVSISRLKPVQDFHVILFGQGRAIENPPRRLVPATRRNKLKVAEFLDSAPPPKGSTTVLLALKRAFEVLRRADERRSGRLIYLLTDGGFKRPDIISVVAWLRDNNKDRRIHVNTCLYGDTYGESAVEVMQRIARENGGRFKFISLDE